MTVSGLDELDGDCRDVEFREFLTEEGLPFLTHEKHQDCVACGSDDGAERHDVEGIKGTVWAGETELVTVGVADTDLVEAGLGVDADPIKAAGAGSKVIGGFIAARDGEAVDKGG